jgi:hypothetical protein
MKKRIEGVKERIFNGRLKFRDLSDGARWDARKGRMVISRLERGHELGKDFGKSYRDFCGSLGHLDDEGESDESFVPPPEVRLEKNDLDGLSSINESVCEIRDGNDSNENTASLYYRAEPGGRCINSPTTSISHSSNMTEKIENFRKCPRGTQRERFASLPKQVSDFLRILLRVYNKNCLDISTEHQPLELIQHAAALSVGLLIPRGTKPRMLQELLGLDIDTPDCHSQADIYQALVERSAVLLQAVEEWLAKLNRLRLQLRTEESTVVFSAAAIDAIDLHRRIARRLCDDVLVVRANIDLRFGRNKSHGEVCKKCFAQRVFAEHEELGRFSDEELSGFVHELRKDTGVKEFWRYDIIRT